MRDFFIFGYKSRNDFNAKSGRTYDNERRHIENYLGDKLKWDYTDKYKTLCISVDAAHIHHNPLYEAYKAKSFTDNDIILHFLLLDILRDESLSVNAMADRISSNYSLIQDPQTIRNKLKEYDALGLVASVKKGKTILYSISKYNFKDLSALSEYFVDMISFFSETSVFSVIGSYILDRYSSDYKKELFLFKHNYLSTTLDDIVLLDIIAAINEKRNIEIINVSGKSSKTKKVTGFPLKIYVSSATGRRYLLLKCNAQKLFNSFRLDYIQKVRLLNICSDSDKYINIFENNRKYAFGTSVSSRSKPEHFMMQIYINEDNELFILNRLEREGRGGTVCRIEKNIYEYNIDIYDSNELMAWVKSYTGRIIKVDGDNKIVIKRFYNDMERMFKLYGGQI